MFKSTLIAMRQELLGYTRTEKIFIICALLCGFFIGIDYAIVRPVSNSLFIQTYGTACFPYAWLLMVPLNFLVVFLYNTYLPRLGAIKVFLITAVAVSGGNLLCACFVKNMPPICFLFYVWKDIYIALMFQLLWSVIHATICPKRAKYLYGILFCGAAMGGICGSLIPGFLAVSVGSERLLFLSFPFYLILTFCYFFLIKYSKEQEPFPTSSTPFRDSIQLVLSSRILIFILSVVVFMQLSSTLIDYQFSALLEREFPFKDERTAFMGKMMVVVNFLTMSLQLCGSFLLVHFLGLRRSHFVVPSLLAANALGFLCFPLFGMMTMSYVTIKSMDFSLFGIIREMLYVPLKPDEKFRAKALIDIFAYRSSKALASFLILGAQMLFARHVLTLVSWGVIVLFILWMGAVFLLLKNTTEERGEEVRQARGDS